MDVVQIKIAGHLRCWIPHLIYVSSRLAKGKDRTTRQLQDNAPNELRRWGQAGPVELSYLNSHGILKCSYIAVGEVPGDPPLATSNARDAFNEISRPDSLSQSLG